TSSTETVSLLALATYWTASPFAAPLGCKPTGIVATCFHLPSTFRSTETVPWLATLVRGSMRTGVPEESARASTSLGGPPPQFVTKATSVPTMQTVYGATPTDTTCSTSPLFRSINCTLLPRVDVTQSLSSPSRAMPAGWAAPSTVGLSRRIASPQ